MGVALGGLSLSHAFEYHTGNKTMSLTAENPAGFVAALNTTFMVAIIFCVVGILTSALRGAEAPSVRLLGKQSLHKSARREG